jgi:hypothetical protein
MGLQGAELKVEVQLVVNALDARGEALVLLHVVGERVIAVGGLLLREETETGRKLAGFGIGALFV